MLRLENQYFKQQRQKSKFYSKLIKHIFSINQCYNQLFLFHHHIKFLILSKTIISVVFSIKILGNLQKMFGNNETLQKPLIEKDYLFSQPVPKQLICLLSNFDNIFRRRY